MLSWILPAKDTPHYISNTKLMANKIYIYWGNGPGRSIPPDPCKCYNWVNLNINSRQARLYLHVVTLWRHTRTRRIYECQRSGSRPRKKYTQVKYWYTENLNLPHRSSLPKKDKQQSYNHLTKAYPLVLDITAAEASMDGIIDDIITITGDN